MIIAEQPWASISRGRWRRFKDRRSLASYWCGAEGHQPNSGVCQVLSRLASLPS